jgi:hypothetical protein
MLERFKNDKRVSEEKKDKIISQLIALKEIIEEKIEDSASEVELDIEELLK